MPFDPSDTYVLLTPEGAAQTLPGGEPFWSRPETELDRLGQDWLVSEFECSSDWADWEMHPTGDELVYLLSGEAVLLLERPAGIEKVRLGGRAAVVVPRGVWHTAKVSAPSRMLFVTMGRGTQHRPA